MAHVLSQNAKLYYNAGTYGTPTWTLISNVRDLTLNVNKTAVDVSTRGGGGWVESVDGLKDASIEFGMVWDTSDAAFTAIKTGFLNNTSVELYVLDGAYNTTGSQGLRATCMIEAFSREENLGDALQVQVTARPVKNSNAAPTWVTVT